MDPDCSEEELNAAFRENTKAVFGESIANPALVVLDFEKFAKAAHTHGVPFVVDNTFATPINCRPFEWGADIVIHSTTKYMDGHASCVGGAIVDSGNFDWEAYGEKFARPWFDPVAAECVSFEYGAGDFAPADAEALRECPGDGKVFEEP